MENENIISDSDNNQKYIIHIDNFDGPLDLLWNLIKRSKIDIVNVSISQITEQYIKYLQSMENNNVTVAAEFITMASELLYYKSKALIPTGEIDDEFFIPPLPEELVEKLLEFKRHQIAARTMQEMYNKQSESYTRENDFSNTSADDEYSTMSLFDLLNAFVDVISTNTKVEEREIVFDEILVSDRINFIISALKVKEQVTFKQLFHSIPSVHEVVATFLACLELAKGLKIKILQHNVFSTVHIFRNFDPDSINDKTSLELSHE
jgi:segregation and condensation protein A